MNANATDTRAAIEAIYRTEARRVHATLIRLLGGFDAAEDAVHEAFAAAAEQWPREGIPANPYAWLVSTGRFKTIDRWRRQARLAGSFSDLATAAEVPVEAAMLEHIPDDELRLIFTCCHPQLAPDAQVALTLREVGGLTTEQIARAYLTPTPTIAQRIVRAKAKIREEQIPFEVPERSEFPARLASVLQVIYLIFNEGYVATEGPDLIRPQLCTEAVRLGRLLVGLLENPEALGLLALMLLHESRRAVRVDAAGDLVLLEDQDRTRWDRAAIAEAQQLIDRAMQLRHAGPYLLQAAIASVHAAAPDFPATDWPQIAALYEVLQRVDPSPLAALNRAVAIGMRDGPQAGLTNIEAAMRSGSLDGYYLSHAARADMQRRLGLTVAARNSYQRALKLTFQPAERKLLEARLAQLGSDGCRGVG